MLLTKTQLLAAQFASALGVLKVEPAGVVWATNGHYLIKVSGGVTLTDDDYPLVAPADSLPLSAPLLIPRAMALAVAKAIPKRSHLPVLGYAQVRALPAGRAVLTVTDLKMPPQHWYIDHQDVTFLAVESVMAFTAKPLEGPIGLSAKYLADIGSYALKTRGNSALVSIRWEFQSAEHAVRFSWTTDAGEEIDGRIMPINPACAE